MSATIPARPIPARLRPRGLSLVMTFVMALGLLAGTAPRAEAWIGNHINYQTHHWFIDQALRLLGTDASWFDAEAARAVVDDPDTGDEEGTYHVYRDSGYRGGAVQRVADHYAAAVRLYGQGKFRDASIQIGLMSHYYTDILQPYHAHVDGIGKTAEHHNYEIMVMNVTNDIDDHPDWRNTGHTPGPISNVRSEAIAAAAFGRSKFSQLHPLVVAAGTGPITSQISEITKPLMWRGVNDLADIIYSVKRGVGRAPLVDGLAASVKWRYPAKSYPYQSVYVTAKDSAGKPIEGLEVRFTVPVPLGSSTTISRITDATGKATWNGAVAASPFGAKQTATARATTDGHTETATAWWATMPVLADGLAGFSSRVDNRSPNAGEYVTVITTLRDTAGRPAAGVPVDWRWEYGSTTVVTTGVSNSQGIATSRRLVLSSTTFARVTIRAHAESGSHNRNSSAWFEREPGDVVTPYKGWFIDIWGSKFRDDIVWLAESGITAGCDVETFCPDGRVTRAQMATFLTRALVLPATGNDYFTDDNSSKHENSINRLAASGITAGCGGTRFCPDGLVTRAQMATFLARAFELAATGHDYFSDDESSKHESSINRLAASGITSGCAPDRFCPSGLVTRGQMAAFLRRALTD